MGSKKVKAILIDDTDALGVKIKDNIKFKQIAKEWIKTLISTKKGLTEYGTANTNRSYECFRLYTYKQLQLRKL